MDVFEGKGICEGIAIGEINVYKRAIDKIAFYTIDKPEDEIKRYESARESAILKLDSLYEEALLKSGEESAMIFQIHQMMLEDIDFCNEIINIIATKKVNAEYAVDMASEIFSKMFSSMDDEYMKERSADIKNISKLLIDTLCGTDRNDYKGKGPVILVSHDFSPSEIIGLDKRKTLGIIAYSGSPLSHASILAKTMGIPAVVSLGESLDKYDGCFAAIDGSEGKIYINPDDETLGSLRNKIIDNEEKERLLQKLKGKDSVTRDNIKIDIYANIGSASDVDAVLKNDAEGIGLFRSELIYINSSDYPSEEYQFSIYRDVIKKMDGREVVIRTMDIGADKQADYFHLPKEENPAMGFRAIRICLQNPDVFKTQLRAIYRASVFGKVSIMFPMINSLDEIFRIKNIVCEVKDELRDKCIDFSDDVNLGVMIETPASVIISDDLAKEVDFFSIGTNDLTQYTLAVDRQNRNLESFYNPKHKAVLRLIKMTITSAHNNGITVCICGEAAADDSLTETFLALGADKLSVSPNSVLKLREKILKSKVSDFKDEILSNLM